MIFRTEVDSSVMEIKVFSKGFKSSTAKVNIRGQKSR